MNASPLSHLRRLLACLSVFLLAMGSASASLNKVFFATSSTTATDDTLTSADLDGSNPVLLASGAALATQPTRIAFDAVNNRLYVVDGFTGASQVHRFDVTAGGTALSNKVTIWSNSTAGILAQGVAVDPAAGYVFIATGGGTVGTAGILDNVFRCGLDGSGIATISVFTIPNPADLAVDRVNQRLYVVNRSVGASSLIRMDYSGGGSLTIASDTTAGLTYGSAAVDPAGNAVYFNTFSGTATDDRLYHCDLSGGSLTLLLSGAALMTQPGPMAMNLISGKLYVDDVTASNGGVFSFDTPAAANRATVFTNSVVSRSMSGVAIGTGTPLVPTTVTSLNRVNASPSNATTVNYTLTFAAAVTGVTASNFSLSGAAATGASVSTPTIASGGGLTWNVPVTTGSTDGTLTLSLANATGTSPGVSTTLPFAGESYTMDKTRPTVSIGAPSASSVSPGGSVTYTVTYADANFASSSLTTGGISFNTTGGASGTIGLSGSGTSYTVTISSITGAGTLGITVGANTSLDTATNANLASAASTTFNVVSNNANLSALVVNTATISPTFGAGTITYTASVSNSTSSVTVTPTRAQANATIEARVNGGAFASVTSGSPSGVLALNLGSNTLDVKVTAQDGTTIKTYTITVTRRSLIEDWRLGFFADASGTSNRANGADFDLDGKTNLLEFAFGTDPTLGSSGPPDLTMTGTYAAATFGVTGQPIVKLEPITNSVDFRAVFIRRVDHTAAGLTYTPEFSGDNFTSFTASATVPTVLATSGSFQLVSVPYPHFLPNGKKARFFRVSVTP